MPEKYKIAIVIGVGQPEKLPPLAGAVNSAKEFAAWATALGYKTTLITDADDADSFQPNPVTIGHLRTAIEAALRAAPGRIYRFIIYFAGHGLIREAEEGLWFLSDWRSDLRVVSIEPLRRRLYLYDIDQITIIADACRSLPANMQQLELEKDPVLGNGPNQTMSEPSIDRFIAVQDGTAALMIPGANPENDFCLFSRVLVEGLWGLNKKAFSTIADQNDKVTSRSLAAFLKSEVPVRAKAYQRTMKPSTSTDFPENEDFYFIKDPKLTAPELPAWPSLPVFQPQQGAADIAAGIAGMGIDTDLNAGRAARIDVARFELGVERRIPTSGKSIKKKEGQARPIKKESALLGDLRRQEIPRFMRNQGYHAKHSGFAIGGEAVDAVWTRPSERAERQGDVRWWKISEANGSPLSIAAPVLIEFEDGSFGAVTALPRLVGSVIKDQRGISAMVYRDIDVPEKAAASAESAIEKLEDGALRTDDVAELVVTLRKWKHVDPILGVISAYLYDAIGDIDSIRRMAFYYARNKEPIPYDIALLGGLQGGTKDEDLWVTVPAVKSRKPRNDTEAKALWMVEATPKTRGLFGGRWPWMRQGWAFLDDPADYASVLNPRGLTQIGKSLKASRFSTLNKEGSQALAKLMGLAPP